MNLSVAVSERCAVRHVGGNTTYVRQILGGLDDVGVRVVPQSSALGSSRLSWALSEALVHPKTARSADVLWYPTDTGGGLSARCPVVSTIHGCASLHIEGVRSRPAEWAWRRRVRRTASLSSRVITGSRMAADDIRRLVGSTEAEIEVIYHGVDHIRFSREASAGEGQSIRERYGLDSRQFVLWLGMLDPKKNLEGLLGAYESDLLADFALVIAGGRSWNSDPLVSAIRTAEVKSGGRVRWIGHVPDADVAPLMREASAFCFPSHYEGFGMPVLEAQACGTAVVSSCADALVEILAGSASQVDHREPDFPLQLARTLHEVLSDESLQGELVEAGFENAARFRWADSVKRHAEVFADAARGR